MDTRSLRRFNTVLALAVIAGTTSPALAGTILVTPDGTGDYPTIQAAIDAATDGDVIELADGTFTGDGNRDVDFLGKAITVRSQSGDPSLCVIDGESTPGDPHGGFEFHGTNDSVAVIEHVSLTGCVTAIWVDAVMGPIVLGCVLDSNGLGAFLGVTNGTHFIDCLITGNDHGAFYGLTANWTIEGCTISGNRRPDGGGAATVSFGGMDVVNSIIWGNCSDGLADEIVLSDGSVSFECSIVDSSGIGEVINGTAFFDANTTFSDPRFCDPLPCETAPTLLGEYTLQSASPALPENSSCGLLIGALDQGCVVVPTIDTSWSRIKSRY